MKVRFDHEKLDVYRLLLSFVAWVTDLLEEVKEDGRQTGEVRDQLHRASLSALLNTAEGNGRRQQRIRAKFFDDARGSSMESAACLDALVAMRCCKLERIDGGKEMLVRIVSMLTKLVERFDESGAGT
jgi:four helix bundle protein